MVRPVESVGHANAGCQPKPQSPVPSPALPPRKWSPRQLRFVIYLLILGAIVCWRFLPRPWRPTNTLTASHHTIYSTASPQHTEEVARALSALYAAYSNRFEQLTGFEAAHANLKLKLYRNREEFRWVNPNLGWAEAFYRYPFCHAYYSEKEINGFHWMLHESVHQLNREVAHLKLEKWLEEGLATYFSTSRIADDKLMPGRIDPNTYPVWWLDIIATEPQMADNLANGSIIPLTAIITNRGGPGLDRHFNLYYLHWWTLTHFICENENYRAHSVSLIQQGGTLRAFESLIGPVEAVQQQWHQHVRQLKMLVSTNSFAIHQSRINTSTGTDRDRLCQAIPRL